MENIIQHLPAALSAVLVAVAILVAATNIIVQVFKGTMKDFPTNLLAVVVAEALTLAVSMAVFQIRTMTIRWYMAIGAVVLGLFVAHAAMYGFDKFKEMLEQAKENKAVKKQ